MSRLCALRVGAGLLVLTALAGASPAFACSVCFGTEATSSPLITSARLAVFLLLGITVAVLGGFAKFFFYLRNRAQQAESDQLASEWAQLQRSSWS